MGWDDLIDLGLDLAGGLFDHDDTRTRGFDALVVSRREDQSKSVRRGRYLLHLARFTGEKRVVPVRGTRFFPYGAGYLRTLRGERTRFYHKLYALDADTRTNFANAHRR